MHFLDMEIVQSKPGVSQISMYDKRDHMATLAEYRRYPHVETRLSQSCIYATLHCQLCRFATRCTEIFRFFRCAYPSSSLRCTRKRPSLLSLACASGRLSFAVGERYYYCVYFLSAISFNVRTYADASFRITIQARSTNTRFTYVQSSTSK